MTAWVMENSMNLNKSHDIQEGRKVGKALLFHMRAGQTGSCCTVQIPGNNAAKKWNIIHTTHSGQSCSCHSSDPRHSTSTLAIKWHSNSTLNLKISPQATYGIQIIRQDLPEQNLKKLEI
jgi:hypothetical protein